MFYDGSLGATKVALEVCSECPVSTQCLLDSLVGEAPTGYSCGVSGNLPPRMRAEILRIATVVANEAWVDEGTCLALSCTNPPQMGLTYCSDSCRKRISRQQSDVEEWTFPVIKPSLAAIVISAAAVLMRLGQSVPQEFYTIAESLGGSLDALRVAPAL